MVIAIIIAVAVLIGMVFFLRFYGTEGILALVINGLPLVYLLLGGLNVDITTVMTGAYAVLTGGIYFVIQISRFHRQEPDNFPRCLSLSYLAFAGLFLLWYIHHMSERLTTLVVIKQDYYKWAYALAYWLLPLILGIVFPLSFYRFQRFLRAVAVLSLILAGVTIIFYFTGHENIAAGTAGGGRYAVMEQVGGGSTGLAISLGVGALFGGYLLCQPKSTARRILFVISGTVLLETAAVLSGSRSSTVIIILAMLVGLGLLRLRYLPIGIVTVIVIGLISYYVIVPLLPERSVARALTVTRFEEGIRGRLGLLWETFNILNVAPIFGRTVGLTYVINADFSHNFTLEILVETGLVGFPIYLAAAIATLVKWAYAFFHKTSPAWPLAKIMVPVFFVVFAEAHAHGNITNGKTWLLWAIMAGHSLIPQNLEYSDHIEPNHNWLATELD